MFRSYKIRKREAEPLEDIMKLFIKRQGLTASMNCQLIFEAWDNVSGAAAYTLNKFYKDGVLYCTISSSVIRNQLFFQKDGILQGINDEISQNSLFDKTKGLVKTIVLK